MSFAAFKMMHWATGIEHCASGFITHSSADSTPKIPPITAHDIDSDWTTSTKPIGPLPNLITAAANVLEVYIVRIQEEASPSLPHKAAAEPLHGNVESLEVLPNGATDGGRRRDSNSFILTFRDAKISVLEFDESICGLRSRSAVSGASAKASMATRRNKATRVSKPAEVQPELILAKEELKKAVEKLVLAESEKEKALDELKETQRLAEEANELCGTDTDTCIRILHAGTALSPTTQYADTF
ncbi:hypothetical protein SASPL_116058 [Salvia splendens]|uniref:Uncharacterized protein n=1 Tax=Salvia splendens TaxID=180675 RepID=A0A8X8Y8S5_SALSN|nr:hypothetical protein SASPL_116058 [Salvia splendens]